MAAYYNEIDAKAAAWLRELIKQGHIAQGEVDERSILEVQPGDLAGFTQCHFFAGIGVWSYALRRAGWADDRPVWTGSCPCQPFSAAGKGDEFADERHLWPAWFRLIRECRPIAIFGEQVASKDALSWLDHVSTDLEAEVYAVGAVDTCAAGFGAPHIRQRLYFVADSGGRRFWRGHDGGQPQLSARSVEHGGVGNSNGQQRDGAAERAKSSGRPGSSTPGAVNGFWADAEWIPCRDGKARPTEPGTFPLVTGAPARLVRLRGYGNSINASQAQHFIEAYLEITTGGQ